MKTVIFYSPKGGVGKSLAAVNFASCLGRCRKNCILIDFDVEAPSLHFKIPTLGSSIGAGGLASLWRASVAFDVSSSQSHEKSSKDRQENLTEWLWLRGMPSNFKLLAVNEPELNKCIPAWEFESRWRKFGQQRESTDYGKVHLLPAGDITRNEYWDTVLSPVWWKAVNCYAGLEAKAIEPEFASLIKGWLVELKKALKTLIPTLEYAVIDFRSGALDPAALVSDAFTEGEDTTGSLNDAERLKTFLKVVCMFSNNPDSIALLAKVWPHIKDFGIPVLSRVPGTISGPKAVPHILNAVGIKESELFLLHTDRAIEEAEFLLFGLNQSTIRNSRLTQEYLRLFSKLMDFEGGDDKLRETLGIGPDPDQTDRIFAVELKTGALINPKDLSRNVSFKVETFLEFLHGMEEGLGAAPRQANQLAQQAFRKGLIEAGRRCGQRFGKALVEQRKERERSHGHSRRETIGEQISQWCEFDSDVGFGKFELARCSDDKMGFVECVISLNESFLSPSNDISWFNVESDPSHRFNGFLTGYVDGVLSEIIAEDLAERASIGSEVSAEHSETPKSVAQPQPLIKVEYKAGELAPGARSMNCEFIVQRAYLT